MNLISISNARTKLPDIVSLVSSSLDRITITVKGQPKAVLISSEELESLEETAEVLSISQAKESILQGLKEAKSGKGIPFSQLR